MTKIVDRFLERKKRSIAQYEENKEVFEKIMGKPKIKVSIELPEGYENQRKDFLDLEKEEAFLKDVNKVVKRHLKKKKKDSNK